MKTLAAILLLAAAPLLAQQEQSPIEHIQDNSFLVEEAYNQEEHVIQHIFNFTRQNGAWVSTLTQEWPVGGQRHQLSYTIPFDQTAQPMLHYRYQLAGSGETRFAVAPRLSLVFPRADARTAVQANVPVSFVISRSLVTHWNAGGTAGHGTRTYCAGGSVIWAALPRIHAMLESTWTRDHGATTTLVSPGIRWSHDQPGQLQIVPGVAMPVDVRTGHTSLFVYLSFEHPFGR